MRSGAWRWAALVAVGSSFAACAQGGETVGTGGSTSSSTSGTTTSSSSSSSSSSGSSSTTTSSSGGGAGGHGGTGGVGGLGGAAQGGFGGLGGSSPGCQTPIVVADPSTVMGDTAGMPDDGSGSCTSPGASDIVYQVNVAQDGVLDLNLDTTDPLALHVREYDCADPFSELDCANSGSAGPQKLSVEVYAGDTLYVFVDGQHAGDTGKFSLSVKSHPPVCGDGIVQGTEACDPPDGITCGSNCQPQKEICNDSVDNDGNGYTDCEDPACGSDPTCPNAGLCAAAPMASASSMGDTTSGSAIFAGSCTGGGAHEQLFSYTPDKDGILALTLSSTADLGLYARTACTDAATELGCTDAQLGGTDEHLTLPVKNGVPITIFVDGYDATEAGAFTLTSALTAVTEQEPNDAFGQANAFADPFYATISPAGDNDWIEVTVPGPSTTLIAQVDDIGTGDCAAFALDSEVEIFAPNGTTSLAFNDDNATDYCSLATATGLAAGSYYIRVSASQIGAPDSTFAYRLKIILQ